jgi:hypothetical protein
MAVIIAHDRAVVIRLSALDATYLGGRTQFFKTFVIEMCTKTNQWRVSVTVIRTLPGLWKGFAMLVSRT